MSVSTPGVYLFYTSQKPVPDPIVVAFLVAWYEKKQELISKNFIISDSAF
jgi:hypothetical protein